MVAEVGRLVLLGGVVVAFLIPVPGVSADVYLKRDSAGVLHFTNVPTEGGYKVLFRAAPPPPTRIKRKQRLRAGRHSRFDQLISEISRRYGVEEPLVKAVIKAESGFRPWAVSPKGAVGLMQLMPETAARHQVRNSFDPRQNIEGGVKHLRLLIRRYRGDLIKVLAAYNAGEKAVDRSGGVPRIAETREYVRRVLQFRQSYLARRR